MNRVQEQRVEEIRKGVMDTFDYSRGKGKFEIKRFEVEENKWFVSVVAEVGYVGDEGTLAEIFARDRVQLFIGKRGGITYPVFKNGKYSTRRFKKGRYMKVHLDQSI